MGFRNANVNVTFSSLCSLGQIMIYYTQLEEEKEDQKHG